MIETDIKKSHASPLTQAHTSSFLQTLTTSVTQISHTEMKYAKFLSNQTENLKGKKRLLCPLQHLAINFANKNFTNCC